MRSIILFIKIKSINVYFTNVATLFILVLNLSAKAQIKGIKERKPEMVIIVDEIKRQSIASQNNQTNSNNRGIRQSEIEIKKTKNTGTSTKNNTKVPAPIIQPGVPPRVLTKADSVRLQEITRIKEKEMREQKLRK